MQFHPDKGSGRTPQTRNRGRRPNPIEGTRKSGERLQLVLTGRPLRLSGPGKTGWTAQNGSQGATCRSLEPAASEPPAMGMIGLDRAKFVFQIHGANKTGKIKVDK